MMKLKREVLPANHCLRSDLEDLRFVQNRNRLREQRHALMILVAIAMFVSGGIGVLIEALCAG